MFIATSKRKKFSLLRRLVGTTIAAVVLAHGAAEAAKMPRPGPNGTYVERFLLEYVVRKLNPEANRAGAVGGDPPAIPLYKDDELVGYGFETWDVSEAVGYSRKPFHILAAIDLTGRITGVHLSRHLEPITALGRNDDDIREYLAQLTGAMAAGGVQVMFDGAAREGTQSSAEKRVDGISRATTSSLLFADAILRGARRVARSRGIELQTNASGRALDLEIFELQSWSRMEADGAISHSVLTNAQVVEVIDAAGRAVPPTLAAADPTAIYTEIWVGLVNPAGIGINLLGRRGYRSYAVGRSLSDSSVFVANRGATRILPAKGEPGFGASFAIRQAGRQMALTADHHEPVNYFDGEGRPANLRQAMFHIAAEHAFDPTRPWQLRVIIPGTEDPSRVMIPIDYRLPSRFIIGGDPDEDATQRDTPLVVAGDAATDLLKAFDAPTGLDWRRQWQDQSGSIILLGLTMAALLAILSLQEVIVRRPRLHAAIRIGFLSWTVGWVGWAVGAQLSVIHVLNWIESVNVGVDWTFFMMEPLIFMLSVFVVIAALLWGRAAFCGWLCPFGALQELLNNLAVRLRVPQIEIPAVVAERLIAVKYLIFFALVGLTFYATEMAYAATGIEPFKAAITFRFDAPLTAVAYAIALLAVGLFVERFYCRFICPLGAGLAILGRLRMFDWLKRRAECGNPCSRCESQCPVRAIRKDGTIDMNECFYCLDCQVVYHDQHQCPPLIKRRKRIEAATSLDAPTAIKASG